ncbi:MAG: PA2169 family four-helix-bundle protein [Fimbriimonadaceae bacterium]|nr:MAG: PA2169 family four-helix-bundle protein [Fimbriimonadaceae bacterium]
MDKDLMIQEQAVLEDHSEANEHASKVLNRVIAKSINSSKEFLTFSGKADSTALFDLCMKLKHRRDDFILALQREVVSLGADPATEQNFAGWVHSGWLKARLAVEPDSDFVIVSEVIREEESMRMALEDALKSGDVPLHMRSALESEMAFSANLRNTMEDIKAKLKPEDYVDVHGK